jgi:hypothetical protein|tara:strand:- start:1247 stop:1522 length:276 start_codon:yes stop_codon:yes gene_type:complete
MINENTSFKTDFKTIGIVVAMVVSVSSTYFSLKAQIDENRKSLENGNWVSSTEYQLKDELVRTTIMSNSKKLDAIEDKLNTIDERLYNLNK